MRETFTAVVSIDGELVITLERRTDSGQMTSCQPIHVLPVPREKFGVTWLSEAS